MPLGDSLVDGSATQSTKGANLWETKHSPTDKLHVHALVPPSVFLDILGGVDGRMFLLYYARYRDLNEETRAATNGIGLVST